MTKINSAYSFFPFLLLATLCLPGLAMWRDIPKKHKSNILQPQPCNIRFLKFSAFKGLEQKCFSWLNRSQTIGTLNELMSKMNIEGLVLPFHSHWYHIKSEALTYMGTNWILVVADILLYDGAHHFLHTFWEYKGGLTPSKLTSANFTSMLNEMKNSSKTTTSTKMFSIYKRKICICSRDTTKYNAKHLFSLVRWMRMR